MKKVVLFLIAAVLIIQPFSVNFTSAQAPTSASEEECIECGESELLEVEKIGVLKDEKVINNVKKSLRNNGTFSNSKYKQADFDWKQAEFLDYGEENNGLMVPLKKNTDDYDVRLMTAYNKSNYQTTETFLMTSISNNETIETSYMDLAGEEFITLTIDGKTAKVLDVKVEETTNSGLLKVNTASAAGYPTKVVNCVKAYWKNASSFTKTVCSAACGGAVFGANPLGIALCASCLGASALSCLIKSA